jgi:hypothetical protein
MGFVIEWVPIISPGEHHKEKLKYWSQVPRFGKDCEAGNSKFMAVWGGRQALLKQGVPTQGRSRGAWTLNDTGDHCQH